jgi:hypothetical protein
MSKRILFFTDFSESKKLNEAIAEPSFMQKVLAQGAEVKAKTSSDDKGKTKEGLGRVLIRDLFFGTKFGQDLLSAVSSDEDLKAAWAKAKIIPSDSPATVEEVDDALKSGNNKSSADKNIESLNKSGKKTQKPDYSLLPQSSDYEFDSGDDFTWDGLKSILDEAGYSKKLDFDQYNLIGLRNSISTKKKYPNRFTDALFLMSPKSSKKVEFFPATTVPGPFFLVTPFRNWYVASGVKNTINPEGTSIIQPGIYDYKIGKHRGQYEALVQRGPVKVQRYQPVDDPKKANFSTYSPGKESNVSSSINIHRGNRTGTTETVDSHSAGCIVTKNSQDLRKIISSMKSNNQNQIKFSLVEVDDISGKTLAQAAGQKDQSKKKNTA